MNLFMTVGVAEVREALRDTVKTSPDAQSRRLNAPLDAALQGMLDESWSYVSNGLLEVARSGRAAVDTICISVWAGVQSVLQQAGAQATIVEERLKLRLRDFGVALQKQLLATVLTEVSIGTHRLQLQSVVLSQTVKLEGSLKAAIDGLLEVSSSGTLELNASYAALPRAEGL